MIALVLTLSLCGAAPEGGPRRMALLVGSNEGDLQEQPLTYAEQDVQRLADTLREVGDFAPQDVMTLTRVHAGEVRSALVELNARIRNNDRPVLLWVFYSGHGDAESLHLDGTRLEVAELQNLLAGSPAQLRLLMVDACRSGGITHVKGGRPGPDFNVELQEPLNAEGLVILTSSGAGEDSHESDALQASFFSHALVSALRGASDVNGDGEVTLREAFEYTSARTRAATVATLGGPQHPTYRYDFGGRVDPVLTWPGTSRQSLGKLEFPTPGAYVVHRGGREGSVVAEVVTELPGRRLSLREGPYFVVRRGADALYEGTVVVRAGISTPVQLNAMRRVDYARLVRKGEGDRRAVLGAALQGFIRGSLFDSGTAFGAMGVGRVDLRQISLELRIAYAQAHGETPRLALDTQELTVGLAALRAFDVGAVTFSLGLEVHGVGWLERFGEAQTPARKGLAFAVGPIGQMEVPVYRGLYWRLELAGLDYVMREETSEGAQVRAPFTFRVATGLGMRF